MTTTTVPRLLSSVQKRRYVMFFVVDEFSSELRKAAKILHPKCFGINFSMSHQSKLPGGWCSKQPRQCCEEFVVCLQGALLAPPRNVCSGEHRMLRRLPRRPLTHNITPLSRCRCLCPCSLSPCLSPPHEGNRPTSGPHWHAQLESSHCTTTHHCCD